MFDFFLCLFFIPYYVFKYISDRAKSDKADASFKSYVDRRAEWEKSVTDIDLENRLNKEIQEHYYDSVLDEEFEEAIREIPGILDIVKYDESATLVQRIRPSYALMILMANRGKITSSMASFGLPGFIRQRKGIGILEEELEMISYLMKWINKKLNEYGINEKPILTKGFSDAYIIDDFEKCVKLGGGTYTWEPNVIGSKMSKAILISEAQN